MHVLNSMQITAKTSDVLAALMKNRDGHQKIVAEARVGYAKAAREALLDQLKKLESGRLSVVNFQLTAPQDHTKVYDTAIEMMKLHTGETVVLDSAQVRTLMMDQWDWKSRFLMANSLYSGTAAEQAGGGDEG
jgi:signal recognition particle GTPase